MGNDFYKVTFQNKGSYKETKLVPQETTGIKVKDIIRNGNFVCATF